MAPTSRPAATDHVHPDTRAMTRHGLNSSKVGASTRWAITPHALHLPAPWFGALRTAPTYLLTASGRLPIIGSCLHHSACAHPDHTIPKHNSP